MRRKIDYIMIEAHFSYNSVNFPKKSNELDEIFAKKYDLRELNKSLFIERLITLNESVSAKRNESSILCENKVFF